jgi:hypothetical protein
MMFSHPVDGLARSKSVAVRGRQKGSVCLVGVVGRRPPMGLHADCIRFDRESRCLTLTRFSRLFDGF